MVEVVETTNEFDLDELKIKINNIGDEKLYVGFPESAKYDDDTPVAGIAAVQEFGSTKRGIPPRPFMRPTVEKYESEWVNFIESGVEDAVIGNGNFSDKLEMLGLLVSGQIKKTISEVYDPPLSNITLALRKLRSLEVEITGSVVGSVAKAIKKGETKVGQLGDHSEVSTKPLVDTGIMISSVSSEVKSQ